MKTTSKKRLNTEKSAKGGQSVNSFLVETSFNSDIDINIRNEIDIKFHQSKANSEYKFPRSLGHKKCVSKQISTKNSFEILAKPTPTHKISKSSTNSLFTETKNTVKTHSKKVSFNTNLILNPKPLPKKNPQKTRHHSYRSMKTDRNFKSKSPKDAKKLLEIYTKNLFPFTCKLQSTNSQNKIFSPYNSSSRLLGTIASSRLKKIYNSVKLSNFKF